MSIKPNATNILPSALVLNDQYNWGGVLARSQGYISASPEGPYLPNQKAQISMPLELVDLRNSTLQFTVTGTAGTGATYTRFNSGIKSIIDRITIQFGSKVILDIQDYNVVSLMQDLRLDLNWQDTVGALNFGYGSTAVRNSRFLDPTYVYAVQLYSVHQDFLHTILPLQKLGVQLILNIYFAPANQCIESDGTNPTYAVNNLQLHYSSLVPTPNWDQMYNEKVRSDNPPSFVYCGYDAQEDTNTCLAGITNFSKVLTYKYTSLNCVMVLFRSGNLESVSVNDKLNNFAYPNITSAYLKIGSVQYPQDNSTNLGDRFSMLCECWGISMQNQPIKASQNFASGTPGSFILAFPLSKHPYEQNEDDNVNSQGIDTSIATSIVLNVQFGTALASNLTMEVIGIYNNCITYNSNGSITWYN